MCRDSLRPVQRPRGRVRRWLRSTPMWSGAALSGAEWVKRADDTYEQLYEYVDMLNTNVGLCKLCMLFTFSSNGETELCGFYMLSEPFYRTPQLFAVSAARIITVPYRFSAKLTLDKSVINLAPGRSALFVYVIDRLFL